MADITESDGYFDDFFAILESHQHPVIVVEDNAFGYLAVGVPIMVSKCIPSVCQSVREANMLVAL